jgi:hypothetical protein
MGIGSFAPVHRRCKPPLSQQSGAGCCFMARGAAGSPAMDGRNASGDSGARPWTGELLLRATQARPATLPAHGLAARRRGGRRWGRGCSHASSPEERLEDWGQDSPCPSPQGEHQLARLRLPRWSGSGGPAPREACPGVGAPQQLTSGGRVAPSPSHGPDLVIFPCFDLVRAKSFEMFHLVVSDVARSDLR